MSVYMEIYIYICNMCTSQNRFDAEHKADRRQQRAGPALSPHRPLCSARLVLLMLLALPFLMVPTSEQRQRAARGTASEVVEPASRRPPIVHGKWSGIAQRNASKLQPGHISGCLPILVQATSKKKQRKFGPREAWREDPPSSRNAGKTKFRQGELSSAIWVSAPPNQGISRKLVDNNHSQYTCTWKPCFACEDVFV